MIFVVKTSEHPSPPPVNSLSSIAKTIRKGEGGGGKRDEQRREGKSEAKGEGIVWGSRGGICCSTAFSLICI